jgi:ABC-type dipeptide/oligopeptide/nickel transport system permease subunit
MSTLSIVLLSALAGVALGAVPGAMWGYFHGYEDALVAWRPSWPPREPLDPRL